MQFKLNSLFLASLCFQFVGTLNPQIWISLKESVNLDLVFLTTSTKFWKYFIILQLFYEHTRRFKTKVWSSTRADTQGNKTSILFKDFECNRTSNSNSKYQLNQNIHAQHHRSGRRAFSKTLRFGIWQRAVNRQPGYRSGNSKGRSPFRLHFSENLRFSKKSPNFSIFTKIRAG